MLKKKCYPLLRRKEFLGEGHRGVWVVGSRLKKNQCPDAGHRLEKKMAPIAVSYFLGAGHEGGWVVRGFKKIDVPQRLDIALKKKMVPKF